MNNIESYIKKRKELFWSIPESQKKMLANRLYWKLYSIMAH